MSTEKLFMCGHHDFCVGNTIDSGVNEKTDFFLSKHRKIIQREIFTEPKLFILFSRTF